MRREIWDGEVFRGYAVPTWTLQALEVIALHSMLPEQEVSEILAELGQGDVTQERAAHLREYLEANAAESPDPRAQFIHRKKIMP